MPVPLGVHQELADGCEEQHRDRHRFSATTATQKSLTAPVPAITARGCNGDQRDHRQQAFASEGLPAGLGPWNGFPAGQQARRGTKAAPRVLSCPMRTAVLGKRRHPARPPRQPDPGAVAARGSQGFKPDKVFPSARNGITVSSPMRGTAVCPASRVVYGPSRLKLQNRLKPPIAR